MMTPNTIPDRYSFINESIYKEQIKQPFDIKLPSYLKSFQMNEQSIFLEATEKNSILIDCSQFYISLFKEKSFSICLREQYPNATGIKYRAAQYNHKEKKGLVEISFDCPVACENALQKQFVLQGNTICVSKSLPQTAQVVHIEISQIPLQGTVDSISKRLIEIFGDYGDILAMGVYVSREGSWFTGHGYTTLNIDKSKRYKKIWYSGVTSKSIRYENTSSIFLKFYFVNSNCTLCQSENHYRSTCPRNLA